MAQRKKRRNLTLYILLAVVAVLIALSLMRGGKKDLGLAVTVEKAQKRVIVETVDASGKIFPEVEVKISSDVSGEIVELYVEEGDSVVKGQLLAKIDPDTYVSILERSEAAVNTAKAQAAASKAQERQIQAQLNNAQQILQRTKQLRQEGVVSAAELESAQTAVETAQANLEAAQENIASAEFNVVSSQANVNEQKENLSRTSIYAPMGGIVSLLNVKKGERVVGTLQMAGTELMRISNMSTLEVQVEVSENEIVRVGLGDTADIEVDAYLNRKFKGIVTQIANSSSNLSSLTASLNTDQVTNYKVRIRMLASSYSDLVSKNKYPFRPGMTASVEVRTNIVENALCVPVQAVTTREEEKKAQVASVKEATIQELVFIAVGDTVEQRQVKTGVQDDTYIQILTGLQDGETVVSGPFNAISRQLKAGSKIAVKEKDELFGKKGASKAKAEE